ncbi:hypothetical protein QYE76_049469 [Lolium multiflorum]|uniref:SWIM-type domain-containing protein n=1 Tax=Lolium multiflorum TaxID=4521 RepID=A0AAD8SNY9_LOLMU|nr:hypothetical protein QYE76_049469 [Lolium multiflorum]
MEWLDVSFGSLTVMSSYQLAEFVPGTHGVDFLDLNEVPFDINEEPGILPPNYFTQLLDEAIDESPQPPVNTHAAVVNVEPAATNTYTGPFVAPTDTTSIAQDGNEDEASSQPNDPHVGMRYDTLEGAKEHYNAHAARKGFSVKVNSNRRSTITGEKQKQQFTCNKFRRPRKDDGGAELQVDVRPIPDSVSEDEADIENAELASVVADLAAQGRKEKAPKKRKRENIVHTFCKAQMVVKLIDGRWEVIHFVPEHNHPLIHKPSLTKYLRSHQGMPKEEKEFVKNLHNTNLTAGKMMEIMSEFYGSELLVPYTTKTITNYCATLTREETKDGDLAKVVSYFIELKEEKDPDFYFRLKLDDEDRVENIFWVDGAARKAYAEAYHDCVSFDATYLTNKYSMPFAPFIGINKHGQSIMLGCGFVKQELATSYDWLFESFLIAMNGLAPDNIITDQDGAMAVSIGRLFPSSVHRNCRWHIMQNAQLKCGPTLGRNPGLAEDFNDCIDFSFSPEEFEAKWALFVGKWPVVGGANSYFTTLYANRAKWVPCYFKHRFFPFLQSTQRSEGFNAILKRYTNPHKSILNFVQQYEKLQTHVLVKEGGNDYRTDCLELTPWSPFPVEEHAYKVYCRDIYLRFRNEFELIGRYNVLPFGCNFYKLEPNRGWCAKYGTRTYLVTANKEEATYYCECSKMDRDGILCCHILKIFTHLGVDEIPDRYILKRWTQGALSGYVPAAVAEQPDVMPPESQVQLRHANLNMGFTKLARIASRTDAATAIVNKHLRAAATEISHLNKSLKKKKPVSAVPSTSAPDQPTKPRDPSKTTTKGRTKEHRTVSALELHPKKKVQCHTCGSFEHNSATCKIRFL